MKIYNTKKSLYSPLKNSSAISLFVWRVKKYFNKNKSVTTHEKIVYKYWTVTKGITKHQSLYSLPKIIVTGIAH